MNKNLLKAVIFTAFLSFNAVSIDCAYSATGTQSSATKKQGKKASASSKTSKKSATHNTKKTAKKQSSSKSSAHSKNKKSAKVSKKSQKTKAQKQKKPLTSPSPAVNIEMENPLIPTTPALISQRKYFADAKKAIRNGDMATALKIREQHLKNYPLNIWIDYWYLTSPLDTSKYQKVKAFIASDDHKELSQILKNKYIEYFSNKSQYRYVLDLIKNKPYSDDSKLSKSEESMQCRYYEALWQLNKADMSAATFAQRVYLNLRPYSQGCSGLIYLWGQKGYLKDSVVLEKFEHAYIGRYYADTTRNLANKLSQSAFADRVALQMSFYDDPRKVVEALQPNNNEDEHKAAVLAFKRFANLTPADATPYFNDFCEKYKLNETEKLEIVQIIAKGFLSRSSTKEQVAWVDKNLPAALWSEEIKIMRMRRAIWFAQWSVVYNLYDHLSESDKKEINWKYWKARSAKHLGHKKESEMLGLEVAKDRSFFGFLAAQKLGKRLPFNHEKLSSKAVWPTTVAHNKAAIRFFEFRALADANASIEWREVAKYGTNDEAMLMAEWALSSGNPSIAIAGIAAGKRWDALDYRFPKPFLDFYKKYSNSTNVPLSFLYGISRQESMLNPNIKSPVGAVGLMQLMPSTAKMVSRQNNWPYKGPSDLVIPENNIRLGSTYLRNMLDRFDNNRVLAAAAYNAGPGRINIWKSKDGVSRDAPMYIENIPFTETRKYVQSVLLYDAIYKKLLTGKEDPLLKKHESQYNY